MMKLSERKRKKLEIKLIGLKARKEAIEALMNGVTSMKGYRLVEEYLNVSEKAARLIAILGYDFVDNKGKEKAEENTGPKE